ncbi:MAG: hypothetical protein ACXVZU_02670 [Methanobacteriaceae archaeon]
MPEVKTSLGKTTSHGDESDHFALKCCIKRRNPETKATGTYF